MRRRGFLALLALPAAGCVSLAPEGNYGLPPCDPAEHEIRVLSAELQVVETPPESTAEYRAIVRGRVRNVGERSRVIQVNGHMRADRLNRGRSIFGPKLRGSEFRIDSGEERPFETTAALEYERDPDDFVLEIENAHECAQSTGLL